MKYQPAVLFFGLAMFCAAQRKDFEQPAMRAARGVRGAVACGSEYAAEAGMRIYFHGGNAVDAGVATMFAASVAEFSRFELGGEAPILIRTKTGKVFSIAGVSTCRSWLPRSFSRNRRPKPGEILSTRRVEGHHSGCRHHARTGAGHGGFGPGGPPRFRNKIVF